MFTATFSKKAVNPRTELVYGYKNTYFEKNFASSLCPLSMTFKTVKPITDTFEEQPQSYGCGWKTAFSKKGIAFYHPTSSKDKFFLHKRSVFNKNLEEINRTERPLIIENYKTWLVGGNVKLGKALSWNDLADLYDMAKPNSNKPARTLSADTIFEWAKKQTNKYKVIKNGTIHKIIES